MTSDYDLGQTCVGYCEEDYLLCLQTCDSSDVDCLSTCGRTLTECSNSCPCYLDCIDGCKGCSNQICFCQVGFRFRRRLCSNDNLKSPEKDENMSACIDENGKSLARCILACNDSDCKMECVEEFETKHQDCPCQVSLTFFYQNWRNNQEKCPYGCPCDDYKCSIPDKKSVLVLSTQNTNIIPVLINYDGGINENLEFKFEDTQAHYSCSALLNGEFYVFGGSIKKKQVR